MLPPVVTVAPFCGWLDLIEVNESSHFLLQRSPPIYGQRGPLLLSKRQPI